MGVEGVCRAFGVTYKQPPQQLLQGIEIGVVARDMKAFARLHNHALEPRVKGARLAFHDDLSRNQVPTYQKCRRWNRGILPSKGCHAQAAAAALPHRLGHTLM